MSSRVKMTEGGRGGAPNTGGDSGSFLLVDAAQEAAVGLEDRAPGHVLQRPLRAVHVARDEHLGR